MKTIKIEKVLPRSFEPIIDLRTPLEFQEDHIPGAENFPILTNEERHEVGTLYKKDPDRAKNLALVYGHEKLEELQKKIKTYSQKEQRVIFYCYRGGMRSGLLVKHLQSMGFPVLKLEGGYKSYRNFVRQQLIAYGEKLNFIVLHGFTGVGKTEILNRLQNRGFPVLDLEGLAQNSGSVFGEIMYPGPSPSQKYFESLLYAKLSSFTGNQCFVEMESRRIGKVVIPDVLYQGLVNSKDHILVTTSLKNRIDIITQDYISNHNLSSKNVLEKLRRLKKILGNDKVETLFQAFESKNYAIIIKSLMLDYYDPLYRKSLKNYDGRLIEFAYEDLEEDLFPWLKQKGFQKNM